MSPSRIHALIAVLGAPFMGAFYLRFAYRALCGFRPEEAGQ